MDELILGDCVEVMKGMDKEIIDLTITSPPYDELRDYKGYTFNFDDTAKQLYRITKQGGEFGANPEKTKKIPAAFNEPGVRKTSGKVVRAGEKW